MVNTDERIHCFFLACKARLTSKKFVSIPCLELFAAVLSVEMAGLQKKELRIDCFHETFWFESKVVLRYIRSNTNKFKIFVANRIWQTQQHSEVEQCRYVSTKIISSDYASRGVSAGHFQVKSSKWFTSPEFLWKPEGQ